jgi:hypothetical protein
LRHGEKWGGSPLCVPSRRQELVTATGMAVDECEAGEQRSADREPPPRTCGIGAIPWIAPGGLDPAPCSAASRATPADGRSVARVGHIDRRIVQHVPWGNTPGFSRGTSSRKWPETERTHPNSPPDMRSGCAFDHGPRHPDTKAAAVAWATRVVMSTSPARTGRVPGHVDVFWIASRFGAGSSGRRAWIADRS